MPESIDPRAGMRYPHDCDRCGNPYDGYHSSACPECYRYCDYCGEYRRSNRFREINGNNACRSCAERHRECPQCHDLYMRDNMVRAVDRDHGARYCANCAQYCRSCGTYSIDGCNTPHRGQARNVGGYHHTHPSLWLGGPLPKNERNQQVGFYVGFELEITSNVNDDAYEIHRWSEEHLGANIFDCKSDSSVRGFEIATQPMTPEYFEAVPWESFFDMLNANFAADVNWSEENDEPEGHGLHVHIGRVAFRTDLSLAAFSYLIGQGDHMQRIGRRQATGYCNKVEKPVSAAIASTGRSTAQVARARRFASGRAAINLGNSNTVEIRSGKSTRSARYLRDTVGLVYASAEYVRALSNEGAIARPKALRWSAFAKWVAQVYPDLFPAISGMEAPTIDQRVQDKDIAALLNTVNTVF